MGRAGGQGGVDWFATLIACGGPPKASLDLRHRIRQRRPGWLVLILLDCSGSTLKGRGLTTAKGIVASLLEAAYLKRLRTGLVQFGGNDARLTLSPRRASRWLMDMLDRVEGGGGTPLRKGLEAVTQVLRRERHRFPAERQTLVLLTDGRSRDSVHGIPLTCRTVVVDLETGPVGLGRCRQIASALQGQYVHATELPVKIDALLQG
jgi:magnesium chelatase subunit ChlD-like protein